MFCKHCGKQIYENSGICPHCGATVIEEKKNYEGEYHSGYEKSETSTKKIIILVVAIVLVIAIGVSAFFIGKKITDDKRESIRQSEKEREEERKKEKDNDEAESGFGKNEEYEVTTVKVENYGSVPFEEETTVNLLLNPETRFPVASNVTVSYGGDLYIYPSDTTKASVFTACINDTVRYDKLTDISRKINDDAADSLMGSNVYVQFNYNSAQTTALTETELDYTQVVVIISGNMADTIIFLDNGSVKGALSATCVDSTRKSLSENLIAINETTY